MKKASSLDFGRAIRLLCARDNCERSVLSKAIGCAPSYISLLSTGHRKNPSSDVIMKMAKFFRCSASEFVALAEGKGGVCFGDCA